MRLLVVPNELAIGGSAINAIDLAAGAVQAGHDVAVYAAPGPLEDFVTARGLEFIPAPRPPGSQGAHRASLSRIARLAALARRRRLDLVHAYEWHPCVEAYYGANLVAGVPLLCTVQSMEVPPLVPPSVPLIIGTEALGEQARRVRGAPVWVLEPPIDAHGDDPETDGTPFRDAYGVPAGTPLVVTVSRLAIDLKLDALVRAIDAVDILAASSGARLLMVGDGPAADALRTRAARVNERHGRDVVAFTGALPDPRSAYAAADVVVGMGSSALRAMSIGRPLIVQGERGFSEIFEPASKPLFLHQGFWGIGDAPPTAGTLADQLRELLSDDARRAELGAYGRRVIEERFALEQAARRQLEIYEEVLAHGRGARRAGAAGAAWRVLKMEAKERNPRHSRYLRERAAARLAAAADARTDGSYAPDRPLVEHGDSEPERKATHTPR